MCSTGARMARTGCSLPIPRSVHQKLSGTVFAIIREAPRFDPGNEFRRVIAV
jgi:hypothetical protein